MNDDELLNALKSEMLLTEARAHGAKEAYRSKALDRAINLVSQRIKCGDMIEIPFKTGAICYKYTKVDWYWVFDEPVLFGARILKNGKPSKIDDVICGVGDLHKVKRLPLKVKQ